MPSTALAAPRQVVSEYPASAAGRPGDLALNSEEPLGAWGQNSTCSLLGKRTGQPVSTFLDEGKEGMGGVWTWTPAQAHLSLWVTLRMAVLVLPGWCRELGATGEQRGPPDAPRTHCPSSEDLSGAPVSLPVLAAPSSSSGDPAPAVCFPLPGGRTVRRGWMALRDVRGKAG
ncbi:unnamed protein product [Rangifer tarandus platyrhynchus]|uniref:Uncharacterized protein n=1 Tax=Rangifer tarandus platyrhynchus TaxID=3082113 RepID=A0ABN8ZF42_RANTA|nr:unnamed protein product [Rangifer tarandus platyrhynchus]